MTDGGAHGIIGNLAKCVNNLANRLDEGTSPPDVVLSPQQPVFSLMKTLLPKMADGGISTEVAKAELAKLNQAMLTLFKKCKPIVGSASVERAAKAWSSICAILDTGDRKGASADSALKSIEVMTSAFGDFCDSYKDKRESAKGSRIGSGLHGKKTKKMDEQLSSFKAWLLDKPINDSDKSRTIGARASQFWKQHTKALSQAAKEKGEKRGYKNAKALAQSYRKTM
ncbi:MAG: hypothetical protein IJI54_10100 [Kiritimatiellae bacterium]|nr:hypothetical protein [Kiritimatiellia bacterium]